MLPKGVFASSPNRVDPEEKNDVVLAVGNEIIATGFLRDMRLGIPAKPRRSLIYRAKFLRVVGGVRGTSPVGGHRICDAWSTKGDIVVSLGRWAYSNCSAVSKAVGIDDYIWGGKRKLTQRDNL